MIDVDKLNERWPGVEFERVPSELVRIAGLPGDEHPSYLKEKAVEQLLLLLPETAAVDEFVLFLQVYRVGYSVGYNQMHTAGFDAPAH